MSGVPTTARAVPLTHELRGDKMLADLADAAVRSAGDVGAAMNIALELGADLAGPGVGDTASLWSVLATLGAADLTVARVVEPHLDAVAILDQAGVPAADGVWGVFAAEGPGEPLRAERTHDGYALTGRKHWCSLGGTLDWALISARVGEQRQLFAVDLGQDTVTAVPATWVARGLVAVDSGPLDFSGAEATPVGEPGWYLSRPGFAWGGIGVAAVWYGGAVGVARRLGTGGRPGRLPDQIARMHLGGADAALHGARCALAEAMLAIDEGRVSGDAGFGLALRVRAVVATAAEEVLRRAAHALGPGPLATDAEHARRVADLELYLRQWHAERDHAALGEWLAPADPE